MLSFISRKPFARVQKKSSPPAGGEDIFEGLGPNYGLGDELVVVEVEELDEDPLAGDDLSITVVLVSVFLSPGGLVTVVSFCSQATRKAMLMRIQMYFMILGYS